MLRFKNEQEAFEFRGRYKGVSEVLEAFTTLYTETRSLTDGNANAARARGYDSEYARTTGAGTGTGAAANSTGTFG